MTGVAPLGARPNRQKRLNLQAREYVLTTEAPLPGLDEARMRMRVGQAVAQLRSRANAPHGDAPYVSAPADYSLEVVDELIQAMHATASPESALARLRPPWRIRRLTGGMRGVVYRVEDQDGGAVIMKFGPRGNFTEETLSLPYRTIAGHGVGPDLLRTMATSEVRGRVKHFLVDRPVIVIEAIDGKSLSPDQPPSDRVLRGFAALCARIHAIPVSHDAPLAVRTSAVPPTPADEARRGCTQWASLPSAVTDRDTLQVLRGARSVLEALAAHPVAPTTAFRHGVNLRTFCHDDPQVKNVIERNDGTLRCIDWDSAGRGHPALEIGYILAHPNSVGWSISQRVAFVKEYVALVPISQRRAFYQQVSQAAAGFDTRWFLRYLESYSGLLERTAHRPRSINHDAAVAAELQLDDHGQAAQAHLLAFQKRQPCWAEICELS